MVVAAILCAKHFADISLLNLHHLRWGSCSTDEETGSEVKSVHKILYEPFVSYSSRLGAGIGIVIILIKWRPRAIQSFSQSQKVIET